jgi:hypothetical protein
MSPRVSYRFDERTGRYRAPSGRFLRQRDVRAAVDKLIQASGTRMRAMTEQLRSRQLTLGDWEIAMRRELSTLHVATATVAKGGRAEMSQSDYGRVGQLVREQFEWLRERADKVLSGQQFADGSLTARAQLYAEAARGTHQTILSREMVVRGFTEERNVEDREVIHCTGPGSCPAETAKGWVPIGTLIPLGQRKCLARDRCHLQYRNPTTGEIAA